MTKNISSTMYQKLSVLSLLALSAAAAASPSRLAKRADAYDFNDDPAQVLPDISNEEDTDIYKTMGDAAAGNAVPTFDLGTGIFTTIGADDAGGASEYVPVPDLPNVPEASEEYVPVDGQDDDLPLIPESPELPEVPEDYVPVDGQNDDLPLVPESPEVPETPDVYVPADGEIDDLPEVVDSPDVPFVDTTTTEADAAGETPAEYVPDVTPTMTTSSDDAEPTMDIYDGEDTTFDVDAESTETTESSTSSTEEPTDSDSTMSESASTTVDAELTSSLEPSDLTTVTVFSTNTFTITDCGPSVTCTGGDNETITSVVAVSTTICPVSEASKFATVAPNPPSVIVVDEDSSDNIVEDVYDQEVVTMVDDEELTTTIQLTSTRVVTEVMGTDYLSQWFDC